MPEQPQRPNGGPGEQRQSKGGRIEKTATEARGGEIILGHRGRIIWIASFVAILLLALIAGLLS